MASLSTTSHATKTLLNKPNNISGRPSRRMSLNIPCKISMTTSLTTRPTKAITPKKDTKKAVPYEKMEAWMRDSVGEIVSNLRESSLLLRVHDDDNGKRVVLCQKAVPEEWDVIKRKWDKKESPVPEGVILVEELDQEFDGVTKTWGVLVQGRGSNHGPLCYLLQTSKVKCSGSGLKCIHFCLMKVKNFRETAFSQLQNSWLLQAQ